MNIIKLLAVFTLLFFGIFAQRFQRHSFDGTQDGYINGNSGRESLDSLTSDGENYVQDSNDVKFVRDSGKVGLELTNDELKFQFCSDGCMGKRVLVCYDCENSNEALRGDCDLNQCDFRAGVKKDDEGMAFRRQNFLWFITTAASRPFDDSDDEICESIVMKSPEAEVTFRTTPIKSCDPKKYDGKVIKLSVRGVKPGCPLYVLNAKKWTPPLTTLPTTQNSTTQITQPTPKSSEANITLWIGIGVGIFILLIIFIVLGYCCYRTQLQKKPIFGKQKGVHQNDIIPEASKKAKTAENEKTADEKEVVAKPESTKEATKEEAGVTKEKQPKPAKKKLPKEKKAPIVEAKSSKEITQENGTNEDAPPAMKVSIEPTLQDLTTEASVVQKSVVEQKQPGNPPRIFVPKKVVLPTMNSDGFKSVSILDTLSGAEDYETQHSTTERPRKNESAGRKKGSKKHR